MKNNFYLLILLMLAGLFNGCVQADETQSYKAVKKPNIILLFADDAGYADFGFQGSKVMQTPNLDKLAASGVVFNQGYVTDATCGPSRAGLLTGRYQQRFGYEEINVPGYMSEHSALLGSDMGLPLDQHTLGDVMQSQGYRTAAIGKWHMGDAERFHPLKRGFDYFYGFRGGDRSYFTYSKENPLPNITNNWDKYTERGLGQMEEPKGYLTDVLMDEALNFAKQDSTKPFFIYLAFNAVHTPLEATEEDLARFPHLKGDRKILAAMTYALDRAVGKLVDYLESTGQMDNTVIVFSNDNGGPSDRNGSSNYPLAGTKSNFLEGGIRVPFFIHASELKPGRYDYPVSTLDLMPTFYALGGGRQPDTQWDGVDLMPYLRGERKGRPHQQLFWKKETRAVVRDGDWKLIRYGDRPAELFDLSKDVGEQNDLAAQEPERVRAMFKTLFNWEMTLERPLWLLKRKYEKFDVERMDRYRVPHSLEDAQ